jgi:hypothetical protein
MILRIKRDNFREQGINQLISATEKPYVLFAVWTKFLNIIYKNFGFK